jgi:hypothetical protein
VTLLRHAGFLLLFAPSMWGDAALRYHTDVQASAVIPAAALDQALGGMRDMEIRIKGNKAYSTVGNLISIADLTSQGSILMDPAHRRFAEISSAQYGDQIQAALSTMPEQARAMLASLKMNLESRTTDRSATIQGIQTEEREFVLTVDMAMPGGPSAPAPFLKMVMQVWIPKPEETERVPALQEFKRYRTSASSAMNVAETIKQVFSSMPGMGDNIRTMVEDMTANSAVSLRTHCEVVMPLLALLSQQMPQQAGQALPAGLDPSAPLVTLNQEVVELSADPVDGAIFDVPAGYQAVSLEEILTGAVSGSTPPQFKQ